MHLPNARWSMMMHSMLSDYYDFEGLKD